MKTRYSCVLFYVVLALLVPATVNSQNPIFFVPPTFPGAGATVSADFNGDGKLDLASGDGTILLGNGDGTFRVGTPFSAATAINPNLIATADFNGDGKADMIVASPSTNTFSILLGNGDGTFQAPIVTTVPAPLTFLAVGDLNGDGKPDVLVLTNTGPLLTTYLGKGNGMFAAGIVSGAVASGTLADFNKDGKLDLLTPAGVQVGNGNGTFQPMLPLPAGTLGASVIGDFNGDGKLDVAGFTPANNIAAGQIQVLFGNGDGTFHAAPVQTLGAGDLYGALSPPAAAAADFNKDGKADLIFDDFPFLQVFTSNGDGTFSAGTIVYNIETQYTENEPPSVPYVIIADFTGDGNLDAAANNIFLSGNGDGTLHGDPILPQVSATVTADFNKDGQPDVAGIGGPNSDNVNIFLNDGKGGFTLANSYPVSFAMLSNRSVSAAADLNSDGNIDLVGYEATNGGWRLFVLLGKGDGSFGLPAFIPGETSGPLTAVVVADVNGDKKPDLVVIAGYFEGSPGSMFVLLGNGDGTFAAPVQYFVGNADGVPAVADFNNDGELDVAVANVGAGGAPAGIGLLLGNGDGTFQPVIYIPTTALAYDLQAADLNGDGNVDLISDNQVFLGNGDGTFDSLVPFSSTNVRGFRQIADFNGDGKLDLLTLSDSGLQLELLLGNGDGTFGNPLPLVPQGIPLVADFNGDGRPDIAVNIASGGSFGLALLVNDAGPPTPDFLIGATPLKPATLAQGNSATSTVTLTAVGGLSASVALSCTGLPSGATCSFAPPSLPAASGTSTVTISTTSATPGGTYPVMIVGTSNGPTHQRVVTLTVAASAGTTTASLAPQTLTFTQQAIGSPSSPQVATLTNTGMASLNMPTMAISGTNAGDFSQTNTCSAALAAGTNCQISVIFNPTGMGARSATLAVSDNATGSPQMVSLAGSGPDFSVTAGVTSATVMPGQTATYTISVASGGGFAQTVALACTGAPAKSTCTVSPSSVVLSGAAQTATVSITTTAAAAVFRPAGRDRMPGIHDQTIPGVLALSAIGLLIALFRLCGPAHRWAPVTLGVLLCAAVLLTSCGGGSSSGGGGVVTGTQAGTYTITVSGAFTAGATTLTHQTNLTLVVQ